MTNTNLFEVATRGKYRFPYKGMISVEDLWDISLEGLDTIYKNLNAEMKKSEEESLLNVKSKENEILANKIAIVKYVFDTKHAEGVARLTAMHKAEQKQKIMEIMAAKQDEVLHNASMEELQKMLNELDV